jgi:catechol 2,3-dioxygenase-like lactoylglutathione lyase family enzyme
VADSQRAKESVKVELSLDHVGAIVSNLDHGVDRWERLGFKLSGASRQQGRVGATDLGVWATVNRLAVFQHGYLELVGVVDPSLPNPWANLMARFEGNHIVALRCQDADQAYEVMKRRAKGLMPPVDRSRQITGDNGSRAKTVKFRNIFSRDDVYKEGRYIVIEHKMPELIWRSELMDHPNGALSLEAVCVCSTEAAQTTKLLVSLCDVKPVPLPQGGSAIPLPGGGAVTIVTPDVLARTYCDTPPPSLPAIAGVVIGVMSLDRTRAILKANGAVFRDDETRLFAPASEANGGFISFVQGRFVEKVSV